MRNRWLCLLAILLTSFALGGCSRGGDAEEPLKGKFDSTSPEAKSAPAAPGPGPGVPRPGKPRL